MVRFFGFSSLPPLVFPVLVLVAYVQILISVETDRETIYDKVSIKSGDGERQRWCGVESIGASVNWNLMSWTERGVIPRRRRVKET